MYRVINQVNSFSYLICSISIWIRYIFSGFRVGIQGCLYKYSAFFLYIIFIHCNWERDASYYLKCYTRAKYKRSIFFSDCRRKSSSSIGDYGWLHARDAKYATRIMEDSKEHRQTRRSKVRCSWSYSKFKNKG